MRTVVLFNHDWLYLPEVAGDDTPDSAFEAVTLPHSNKLLPHHNFDSADYAFISTYRKRFTLPEPLRGRRAYLDFDGVMLAATVTLNGHPFPEHRGGFTPFSVDITDYVVEDRDNCLTVQVDSTERPDIPPYGNVVDYMTFGGIYRDVRLRLVEPVHISSVFVKTSGILTGAIRLSVEVRITNLGSAPAALSLYGLFADDDYSPELDVTLAAGTEQTYHLDFGPFYEDIELWSLERPALYELMIDLLDHDQSVDSQTLRFGFREAEFRQDGGFYLNGERVKLMGLNRHQNYPYIGPAAPPRLQRLDADIIRFELGCNIVRTSHYPQSPHFLDRCDEIGLLVLEEIPGWQHIGDEDWQSLVVRDVRAMIERDRNHPSIILWGVRVNELPDHEFLLYPNQRPRPPTRSDPAHRRRAESIRKSVFGGCIHLQRLSGRSARTKPHPVYDHRVRRAYVPGQNLGSRRAPGRTCPAPRPHSRSAVCRREDRWGNRLVCVRLQYAPAVRLRRSDLLPRRDGHFPAAQICRLCLCQPDSAGKTDCVVRRDRLGLGRSECQSN